MLRKDTIENFMKKLESAEPAPGGGSAAALAGCAAAALVLMTINITLRKTDKTETKEHLLIIKRLVGLLKNSLLSLIDQDALAYQKVISAFKLPRNTKKQKEKRYNKIQEAFKIAALTPFQTALSASEITKTIGEIKALLSKNVASDVEVAELLSAASIKGAIANVKINLPAIADKKFKKKIELALKKI